MAEGNSEKEQIITPNDSQQEEATKPTYIEDLERSLDLRLQEELERLRRERLEEEEEQRDSLSELLLERRQEREQQRRRLFFLQQQLRQEQDSQDLQRSRQLQRQLRHSQDSQHSLQERQLRQRLRWEELLERQDRTKKFAAQLALALKEGSVKLNITKCVFQGPPRVGKTHVKCLLLKQKMEKRSDPTLSTSCAEHPERAIRKVKATAYAGRKGEAEWELMDDELLARMISQIANQLNLSHEDNDIKLIIQSLSAQKVFDTLKQNMLPSDEATTCSSVEASLSHQYQDLMYFIDSGGQPQFQEVLQAFIPDTDVLLLAFNLTQKLSESPLIQYQTKEGTHTHGKYAISNEEIISRFARMVYSSNSKVYVGLIGTHYDQYSPDKHEMIEEKNRRLSQIFSFCTEHLLYYDSKRESLLFPINALQAEDEVFDDPVVCQLRKAIEFVLNNVLEVEVPLRWYALELSMQQYAASTGIQVLSRDTCFEMAKDLQFTEKDALFALEFLAKYNLILYYPSILPNVVFTSPQVLLDKVTELTECVYSLDASANGPMPSTCTASSSLESPPIGDPILMKKEGLITDGILKWFSTHYQPGLFTFQNLIEIFQHLYIISCLDDGRYFMPALLPHFTPSELSHLYDPSKPPLLFHFTEGCAPTGLFCALLVCLTSSKRRWKFGHHLENSSLDCIRSNAACLIDPQFSILIILVDSFQQFEAHYRCQVEDEKYFPDIKNILDSALKEVIKNRKFKISFPVVGFWCEGLHSSKPPRHICTVVNQRLRCSINSMVDCKMTPVVQRMAGLLPFSKEFSSRITEAPTLQKLLRICGEVASKWTEVGIQLEVPYPMLESIKTEKTDNVGRLVAVFAYWQNNPSSDRPFTWQTMVDVLRDIKNNALADKIRDKYLPQEESQLA